MASFLMEVTSDESAGIAVLDGDPLDAREHPVEPDTTELLVAMTDGARHLYAACQKCRHLLMDAL